MPLYVLLAFSRSPLNLTLLNSVSTKPGLILVTLIFESTKSILNPSEKVLTAALEAQ